MQLMISNKKLRSLHLKILFLLTINIYFLTFWSCLSIVLNFAIDLHLQRNIYRKKKKNDFIVFRSFRDQYPIYDLWFLISTDNANISLNTLITFFSSKEDVYLYRDVRSYKITDWRRFCLIWKWFAFNCCTLFFYHA